MQKVKYSWTDIQYRNQIVLLVNLYFSKQAAFPLPVNFYSEPFSPKPNLKEAC